MRSLFRELYRHRNPSVWANEFSSNGFMSLQESGWDSVLTGTHLWREPFVDTNTRIRWGQVCARLTVLTGSRSLPACKKKKNPANESLSVPSVTWPCVERTMFMLRFFGVPRRPSAPTGMWLTAAAGLPSKPTTHADDKVVLIDSRSIIDPFNCHSNRRRTWFSRDWFNPYTKYISFSIRPRNPSASQCHSVVPCSALSGQTVWCSTNYHVSILSKTHVFACLVWLLSLLTAWLQYCLRPRESLRHGNDRECARHFEWRRVHRDPNIRRFFLVVRVIFSNCLVNYRFALSYYFASHFRQLQRTRRFVLFGSTPHRLPFRKRPSRCDCGRHQGYSLSLSLSVLVLVWDSLDVTFYFVCPKNSRAPFEINF
jgi:hypothetical protein